MKRIDLRLNEQMKYDVIKKLVETNGNKDRAAIKLNCTRRTINRMIKGYQTEGKVFFQHGNRNRKPAIAIDDDTKTRIVDLYLNKYYDANFKHFTELLIREEQINHSVSAVTNILTNNDIISPKANRVTKKKQKKKLKQALENTSSKKEK